MQFLIYLCKHCDSYEEFFYKHILKWNFCTSVPQLNKGYVINKINTFLSYYNLIHFLKTISPNRSKKYPLNIYKYYFHNFYS